MTCDEKQQMMQKSAGRRLALIPRSFERLTGKKLQGVNGDNPSTIWSAPIAIVAHDTQADPQFFYGNQQTLELFDMEAAQLIGLPSRFSAEPVHRDERDRMFTRVTANGYIDDYTGIRISAKGRRFRIEQAYIWNLIDQNGVLHGQAAAFDNWTDLD